jgi:hypothetical protein
MQEGKAVEPQKLEEPVSDPSLEMAAGSVPVSTAPAGSTTAAGITTTPAARAFLTHVSETAKLALAQRRPWSEMVDRNSFAKPENFSEALTRIRKNCGYFRVNYLIILMTFVAASLVFHVGSLLTLIVILGAWGYLYMVRRDPLVIWGRTFNEREILVIMTGLTVIGLFLSNVATLILSAVLLGGAVVAVHGALRVPDDLFLDDQESSGGFLSFLGTGIPQPPAVASHV